MSQGSIRRGDLLCEKALARGQDLCLLEARRRQLRKVPADLRQAPRAGAHLRKPLPAPPYDAVGALELHSLPGNSRRQSFCEPLVRDLSRGAQEQSLPTYSLVAAPLPTAISRDLYCHEPPRTSANACSARCAALKRVTLKRSKKERPAAGQEGREAGVDMVPAASDCVFAQRIALSGPSALVWL